MKGYNDRPPRALTAAADLEALAAELPEGNASRAVITETAARLRADYASRPVCSFCRINRTTATLGDGSAI